MKQYNSKHKTSKILTAFLALMLLFCSVLSSCGGNGSGGSDTEAPAEILQLDFSSVDSIYVVRPENASESIIKEMQDISKEIKDLTSAKISLSDDWYRNEADIDRYEIIIGNVNRSEVAEAYKTIRANDYQIGFSGKRLWILGGTDSATLKAAKVFHELLKNKTGLKFEAPNGILAEFTDTYEINEASLFGKPFRDYKLLYSSTKNDQKLAVSSIVSLVQSKAGYVLASGTNLNEKTDCKIVFKTVYADGTAVELYDYSLENEGSVITVYAGSGSAFRYALKLLFDSFSAGELSSADSTVSIKGKYVYSKDTEYDVLSGIRMYAMGDSYFAGSGIEKTQVWPCLVALKYGMKFSNYGIGGSTISNYVTDHNPMVERITSMNKTAPDIILFEGGRNDYNQLAPLGDKDSRDSTTFRGAIRLSLEKMHKMYPDALIICITNWNFPGTHGIADCYGYAGTFEEIAGEYSYAACINATDLNVIPINVRDEKFRHTFFIEDTDISHLNAAGMIYAAPYFEERIAYYYTAFLNGNLEEVK